MPQEMKAFMLKVRMPAERRHIYLNFYRLAIFYLPLILQIQVNVNFYKYLNDPMF